MESVSRKRQHSALYAAALMGRPSSHIETVHSKPRFHFSLWISFTLQNWLLDVGRYAVTLFLPSDWFPVNRPGPSELLHFLFSISTPLTLLKMVHLSPRPLPPLCAHLCVISVTMGTSLHLATEALVKRLLLIGYQPHMTTRENPLMKDIKPSALMEVFEFLFYLDETVGRLLWFAPFFLSTLFFFGGAFSFRKQRNESLPLAGWLLLLPNAVYYWFLVCEGQTFILFLFSCFAMTASVLHHRRRGMEPDSNGLFIIYSFSLALALILVWTVCLWNEEDLRRRYPGLIYVPQPRAFYTLYTHT